MKINLIIILLGFLLIHTFSGNCDQISQNDLLQSGFANFINANSPAREHCFDVNIGYNLNNKGFQVALSINQFTFGPSINGIDYSVRGGQRGTSNTLRLLLLINDDATWTNIRVSYLVSSRSDFWLGSYIIDTFSIIDCNPKSYQDSISTSLTLPSWTPSGSKSQILIFISGLRTKDNTFTSGIKDSLFDDLTGKITVNINTNAYPSLEIIHISYVIYRIPPFTLTAYTLPFNLPTKPDYTIQGINAFQIGSGSAVRYYGLSIVNNHLDCIGKPCIGTCIQKDQCKFYGGNINGKTCIFCSAVEIYDSGNCRPVCGPLEVYSGGVCVCSQGYVRIGRDCIKVLNCGANQAFDMAKGICVCNNNYVRINNQCVPIPRCGNYQTLVNNVCVCQSNCYRNSNGVCTPNPVCGNNQIVNNGICVCIDGCARVNNQCIPIPRCGNYQTLVNNVCVCQSNCYRNSNGVCTPNPVCGNNQIVNNGICVCIDGCARVNNQCIPIPRCGNYQTLVNNVCVCQSNCYRNSNGVCTPNPVCGNNQIVNNGICVCIDGCARVNNQCIPIPRCGNYQTLVNNVCVCQSNCYRNSNGVCTPNPVCGNNQIVNNGICVCIDGCARVNNQCIPIPRCGNYQTLVNNVCVCQSNCYRNSNGVCTPNPVCGNNQIVNNGICVCIDGCARVNNQCIPIPRCGNYQTLVNNVCVCQSNYYRNSNGVCVPNQSCGINQVFQNGACNCADGFIRLGPFCVQRCGLNQNWTGTTCVCMSTFARINGVCRACPPNSSPNSDSTTCICNNGFSYNSTSSICEVQQQCQANAIFNQSQNRCICLLNYYQDSGICKPTPVCPLRSSWNQSQLKCICSFSGQYLINSQCQTCGTNQGWDGKSCVCQTGFYRINGSCRTCAQNTFYNNNDCICNPGWFGNRDGCWKCDPTCSQCTGMQPNQCTSCVDVSYTLNSDGTCARKTPCPIGLYLDGLSCKPCSSYCSSCNSANTCLTCISGFTLTNTNLASVCVQICGDGKRFEVQCDDGNTNNGDGCNSNCKVQQGWTCVGGSTVRASSCSPIVPNSCVITPKAAVLLPGRVVHGVRLSYIPPTLTADNCPICSSLLWIKVTNSQIVPGVRVNYVPSSQFQFMVQFDFFGTYAIPIFKFTIQLNPQYQQYFSSADMSQVQIVTVDPALLAKYDKQDTLDFSDIDPKQIKVPQNAIKDILA